MLVMVGSPKANATRTKAATERAQEQHELSGLRATALAGNGLDLRDIAACHARGPQRSGEVGLRLR